MPSFRRGDLTLHYAEYGPADGRPVVLMHGLTLSSRSIERLARHLPDFRVVLLDLHGHGQSSKPHDPDRYSADEFVADAVALLDHLGLASAVVGGMSLGANVAYQLALDHPERVDALILEMPVFGRGERFARAYFRGLIGVFAGFAPIGDAIRAPLRRIPWPEDLAPELVQVGEYFVGDHRALVSILRGLLREQAPAVDPDTLASLTVPALVVGHRGDLLHVLADVEELAEALPNARLYVAATFWDFRVRPDRLAEQITLALEDLALEQPDPARSRKP